LCKCKSCCNYSGDSPILYCERH